MNMVAGGGARQSGVDHDSMWIGGHVVGLK